MNCDKQKVLKIKLLSDEVIKLILFSKKEAEKKDFWTFLNLSIAKGLKSRLVLRTNPR